MYLCVRPRECPSHKCLPVSVCVGVFQRERAQAQIHAHRRVHVSVCGGACTWACRCGHERACGQVRAHGSVPVCRCVCVRVKESTVELHSHGHVCLCACLHRWLHMGVGWPGPGGMLAGMWSLPCLPAWGGKRGLLLDKLGMAWGWAAWGSRHTDQGLQSVGLPGAPQEHRRKRIHSRTGGRAMFPRTPPSLLPSPVPDPHPLGWRVLSALISKASSIPPPPVQGERPREWLPRGGAFLSCLPTRPVSLHSGPKSVLGCG